MRKSRQSNQTAKTLVSPFFAWSNAVLKGGEMVLNSMEAAAKTARNVRVAVLPDADAPRARPQRKAKSRSAKAKRRRR